MPRARATSSASTASTAAAAATNQELGSMYDYLAKVILLGPSGAGKSCLLHRFLHSTFRTLTSQTIGVEFASKIISIGPHPSSSPSSSYPRPHHHHDRRRKRIKLQLWDTAGTERFRSVSRSYYRGAAGAILVYDVSSWRSFADLRTFLDDARALASRQLCVVLAGNKCDVDDPQQQSIISPHHQAQVLENPAVYGYGNSYTTSSSSFTGGGPAPPTPSSQSSSHSTITSFPLSTPYTLAPEGREVPSEVATRWAGEHGIPVAVEVSALTGEGVEELFAKLARMILTKIELGEIDPDDPTSGIQYGDIGGWGGFGGMDEGGSVKSGRV
ncbi:ras-domain-containing protein, partial [Westerdykella ornata]